MKTDARSSGTAWSPLRIPVFRMIWTANLVSNTGTWLSMVGATWLMTLIAPSPLMVSLVQAASTLPVFVFALPAGALADIVDQRRLLIGLQSFMGVVAALLWATVMLGRATPIVVLAATFLTGIGAALAAPAFQSIVPDLVPRQELRTAITLNGVGINVSRAIGPAVAGMLIPAFGIASPFLLNALSFIPAIAAFQRWKAPARQTDLPGERFSSAIRTGLRYTREAPELRATLVHAGAFFLFASGYWALLPLIARDRLGGEAASYGVLLGCLGVGAIAGAFALPKIRRSTSADIVVLTASLVTAAIITAVVFVRNLAVAAPLMLIAGACWIAVLSTLNVAAQVALPAWVKARGLSVYLLVFNGGLAFGSPLWGFVANRLGMPLALAISASGLAAAALVVLRWKLPAADVSNLAPSMHWPAPLVALEDLEAEKGPVMIEIEYRIDPAQQVAFSQALQELGRVRRRDGAIFWQHFVDVSDPARNVEVFMLESWLQHLRQHERVTVADRPIQERVLAFHVGDSPPRLAHFVAEKSHREPA